MALFDNVLGGGNWVTGLAIGVGAAVVLPLVAPILRPVAKTAIKGGILAYQGRLNWSRASVISSPKLSAKPEGRPPRRRLNGQRRPHGPRGHGHEGCRGRGLQRRLRAANLPRHSGRRPSGSRLRS